MSRMVCGGVLCSQLMLVECSATKTVLTRGGGEEWACIKSRGEGGHEMRCKLRTASEQ